jgi:predicted GNAT family acetyltransferase
MPLGEGALAVAYQKVEDGRIVLLHTEVPQEPSGLGYGSRLAHCVFEALRRDGKRVNATALSCLPTRPDTPSTAHSSTADRRRTDAGAHSAFGRRYLTLSNACPKGISNFAGRVRC